MAVILIMMNEDWRCCVAWLKYNGKYNQQIKLDENTQHWFATFSQSIRKIMLQYHMNLVHRFAQVSIMVSPCQDLNLETFCPMVAGAYRFIPNRGSAYELIELHLLYWVRFNIPFDCLQTFAPFSGYLNWNKVNGEWSHRY